MPDMHTLRVPRGSTLLQLVVAVAIVLTLSALSVAGFQRLRLDAGRSMALARFRAIQEALEAYYLTNQTYPQEFVDLTTTTPAYIAQAHVNGSGTHYVALAFASGASIENYVLATMSAGHQTSFYGDAGGAPIAGSGDEWQAYFTEKTGGRKEGTLARAQPLKRTRTPRDDAATLGASVR